jgi:mRNA interferase HigB
VRVIARKILKEFWEKHEDCEQQLKSWFDEAIEANCLAPKDIKVNYPSASF